MRTLLFLLLASITALAQIETQQPDLRLALKDEYGPQVRGLLAQGLKSSFHISPMRSNSVNIALGMMDPLATNEIRRLLNLEISLVNIGGGHWDAGNVFAHPERYEVIPGHRFPFIRDLYGVTISAVSNPGHILLEQNSVCWLHWDAHPALPGLPNAFNIFAPGTSAGHASLGGTEGVINGTFVDVSRLTNGSYDLTITVDPLNTWNQHTAEKSHTIRFDLAKFDAWVWPARHPNVLEIGTTNLASPTAISRTPPRPR